ncbi:hypothetical protein Y032_0044g1074 [Ancylostoma ceylanicum]|uniref:Uncharacterized protein n=1 Tax=Ancylostoma ceylanicum TaxID=53326 RepID=A0A016UDN4_9BILA|nr:hypothetical protein Y032_0044g1074 [Ancylostoma ceylanicum]
MGHVSLKTGDLLRLDLGVLAERILGFMAGGKRGGLMDLQRALSCGGKYIIGSPSESSDELCRNLFQPRVHGFDKSSKPSDDEDELFRLLCRLNLVGLMV